MRISRKQPNLQTVTTINTDGSRFFLHPADVRGRFARLRRISAVVLILVYVLMPWIPVGGHPAVFLDVLNRRFHLFGWTLAAQDMWLLFFLVSGVAFFLFYLTAFLGRVWCGWACPQTVFLDHVFRRVERWIDGDAPARKQLDAAAWTPGKIFKRLLKHSIFLILSAMIAHVFLSYFLSIPQLWEWMRHSPLQHMPAFIFVAVLTGVLYFNFAWFREQLCIVICPYGRFQSALVDEHSLNVAYDYGRDDCVECSRCVQVCPTGIDIRQGLQLECIGCTACIDACDTIMDKVKKPRGLIRYASDRNLQGLTNKWLRPRTVLYTALMFLGIAAFGIGLKQIDPVFAAVTRMTGSPFYVTDTSVRNQYQVRMINKTEQALRFHLQVLGPAGMSLETAGNETGVELQSLEERNISLAVQVPREVFAGKFEFTILVLAEPGGIELRRAVEFVGPDLRLLNRQSGVSDEK